jgi:hypothetical protein
VCALFSRGEICNYSTQKLSKSTWNGTAIKNWFTYCFKSRWRPTSFDPKLSLLRDLLSVNQSISRWKNLHTAPEHIRVSLMLIMSINSTLLRNYVTMQQMTQLCSNRHMSVVLKTSYFSFFCFSLWWIDYGWYVSRLSEHYIMSISTRFRQFTSSQTTSTLVT